MDLVLVERFDVSSVLVRSIERDDLGTVVVEPVVVDMEVARLYRPVARDAIVTVC